MTKAFGPIQPEVRESMQRVARMLHEACPPETGFCLLMFKFGEGGFINYISDAQPASMLAALKEFIALRESEVEPEGEAN